MELLALESRVSQFNELDFITDLTNKGLANEIVTRLQLIGEKVSYIADQSFQIGKIILMKLWDFIKETASSVKRSVRYSPGVPFSNPRWHLLLSGRQ